MDEVATHTMHETIRSLFLHNLMLSGCALDVDFMRGPGLAGKTMHEVSSLRALACIAAKTYAVGRHDGVLCLLQVSMTVL